MIIWGFKTTRKIMASLGMHQCGHCHNTAEWQLMKITHWFHLFFIPIIPYKKEYFVFCSICNMGYMTSKEDAERIVMQSAIPTPGEPASALPQMQSEPPNNTPQ